MRRAPGVALLLTFTLAMPLGGCGVYYPMVSDVGGTRIRPENGRAVRQSAVAMFYADLHSTGKFGDTLTAVQAPVAREARVVNGTGEALAQLDVPGATVVSLQPDGPHVVLSGLTRELVAGEVIIVTLVFAKSGNVGVVTRVE
jgi:copper(I)-binding protein